MTLRWKRAQIAHINSYRQRLKLRMARISEDIEYVELRGRALLAEAVEQAEDEFVSWPTTLYFDLARDDWSRKVPPPLTLVPETGGAIVYPESA